ncbi:MAG: hypothetical protein VX380_09300 [Verrucomicrobiota bacterium]|nr:hypothetical protein [Verrucomicrobiota bacterium]MEC7401644.1 hypothetical protein [Verrucomicrobiota bacterium]MEC7626604.1 hypothetical protein [Verrucomicrobiota bacterium]MEC8655342.1 hypothetical protein [Verrucomicrobiota bacterium]MEC8777728.1 hypothetical protein [Verrucomicrobiota bacterium]
MELNYFLMITGEKGGDIRRSRRELPIMTFTMRTIRRTGACPNGR